MSGEIVPSLLSAPLVQARHDVDPIHPRGRNTQVPRFKDRANSNVTVIHVHRRHDGDSHLSITTPIYRLQPRYDSTQEVPVIQMEIPSQIVMRADLHHETPH